ncbi:hypothetical protein G9A89_013626 [Geosiphon pyriformis]|nr:hypothetical protein G9A89_013626 [Geosiphon pyriformis]
MAQNIIKGSPPSLAETEQDEIDKHYMRVAIEQANLSIQVDTAYCVGAVLVKNSKILSTGYSRELPGNTHAEECALLKLSSTNSNRILNFNQILTNPSPASSNAIDLADATIYTTMEPCSTRLSGNLSCVERILEAGIKRVVLGIQEPDRFVKCVGVELLKARGLEVVRIKGFEEECLKPNSHILNRH